VITTLAVMTRTRETYGMPQVNRPALLLGDDRVISNRWLSSSSSMHDGGGVRDVTAGRTTVLGRAAAHLNVHGALTNCATCIAVTEERRLHGRSNNCSTLRGRGRWGDSGGGGILEKCDARVFL